MINCDTCRIRKPRFVTCKTAHGSRKNVKVCVGSSDSMSHVVTFTISYAIEGLPEQWHTVVTPDRRQSKTLLIIAERGSKIAINSVFDYHLSPIGRQMAIENSVSNYF